MESRGPRPRYGCHGICTLTLNPVIQALHSASDSRPRYGCHGCSSPTPILQTLPHFTNPAPETLGPETRSNGCHGICTLTLNSDTQALHSESETRGPEPLSLLLKMSHTYPTHSCRPRNGCDGAWTLSPRNQSLLGSSATDVSITLLKHTNRGCNVARTLDQPLDVHAHVLSRSG